MVWSTPRSVVPKPYIHILSPPSPQFLHTPVLLNLNTDSKAWQRNKGDLTEIIEVELQSTYDILKQAHDTHEVHV